MFGRNLEIVFLCFDCLEITYSSSIVELEYQETVAGERFDKPKRAVEPLLEPP